MVCRSGCFLFCSGLFSGSLRARRQVAVRTGTSSHPGRLTQPQEVAQRCWSWTSIHRASALLPSPTSENPEAAKLCPCSRLLLALRKQPRRLSREEIPLFAPQNLCYQTHERIARRPTHLHICTGRFPRLGPIPTLFRQQDPSLRPPRCPSLILPPWGTGPKGFRSLNHLQFPLSGMSGCEQRQGVADLGQEERGRGWGGGSEPLPGA